MEVTHLQLPLQLLILLACLVVALKVHRAKVTLNVLDLCNATLQVFHGLPMAAHVALGVELGETATDHVLHTKLFHSQQVEDHGVGQTELRLQLCGSALKELKPRSQWCGSDGTMTQLRGSALKELKPRSQWYGSNRTVTPAVWVCPERVKTQTCRMGQAEL